MAIVGKNVLVTQDEASSEYSEGVTAESILNARTEEPLSLSEAVKIVEGLRSCKGVSRSQILVTLRNRGATESTINLAIKRNSQVNSIKKGNI